MFSGVIGGCYFASSSKFPEHICKEAAHTGRESSSWIHLDHPFDFYCYMRECHEDMWSYLVNSGEIQVAATVDTSDGSSESDHESTQDSDDFQDEVESDQESSENTEQSGQGELDDIS